MARFYSMPFSVSRWQCGAKASGAVAIAEPKVSRSPSSRAILAGLLMLSFSGIVAWRLFASSRDSKSPIQAYLRDLTTCCSESDLLPFIGQADAVKGIQEMLTAPTDAAHWFKAVLALGAVAPYNDRTVDQLWRFLSSDVSFASCLKSAQQGRSDEAATMSISQPTIDNELARAKVQVPVAIGSLLARSPGRSYDLRRLIAGTNPQYWSGRIHWSGQPLFSSDEERNVFLASQCVTGLSFSGQPEAKAYIIGELRAHPPSKDIRFLDSVEAASCVVTKCKQ